jgi:hypothetical protein
VPFYITIAILENVEIAIPIIQNSFRYLSGLYFEEIYVLDMRETRINFKFILNELPSCQQNLKNMYNQI